MHSSHKKHRFKRVLSKVGISKPHDARAGDPNAPSSASGSTFPTRPLRSESAIAFVFFSGLTAALPVLPNGTVSDEVASQWLRQFNPNSPSHIPGSDVPFEFGGLGISPIAAGPSTSSTPRDRVFRFGSSGLYSGYSDSTIFRLRGHGLAPALTDPIQVPFLSTIARSLSSYSTNRLYGGASRDSGSPARRCASTSSGVEESSQIMTVSKRSKVMIVRARRFFTGKRAWKVSDKEDPFTNSENHISAMTSLTSSPASGSPSQQQRPSYFLPKSSGTVRTLPPSLYDETDRFEEIGGSTTTASPVTPNSWESFSPIGPSFSTRSPRPSEPSLLERFATPAGGTDAISDRSAASSFSRKRTPRPVLRPHGARIPQFPVASNVYPNRRPKNILSKSFLNDVFAFREATPSTGKRSHDGYDSITGHKNSLLPAPRPLKSRKNHKADNASLRSSLRSSQDSHVPDGLGLPMLDLPEPLHQADSSWDLCGSMVVSRDRGSKSLVDIRAKRSLDRRPEPSNAEANRFPEKKSSPPFFRGLVDRVSGSGVQSESSASRRHRLKQASMPSLKFDNSTESECSPPELPTRPTPTKRKSSARLRASNSTFGGPRKRRSFYVPGHFPEQWDVASLNGSIDAQLN